MQIAARIGARTEGGWACRASGFTLVEVLVAAAILLALMIPLLSTTTWAQLSYEATSAEATEQTACTVAAEHLTRHLRAAVSIERLVPGEALEFLYRGDDGRKRLGRYQFGWPEGGLQFAADWENDPGAEVLLARSVAVSVTSTDPSSLRRINVSVSALKPSTGPELPGTHAGFSLETSLWRRPNGLLLQVSPPRVEGAP